MRLSTEPDRDEATAIEVLHAAFDAGITLLDTANAYAHDEAERGFVNDGGQDPSLARRLGFVYRDAADFVTG